MLYLLRLMFAELTKLNTKFNRDPRTSHLPLLGSPMPMVCILVLYVLFVKKWGPALMAKRKPMELKLPMQIYNVMQVLLNLYVVIASASNTYGQPNFHFLCQPYNTQDTSANLMELRVAGYVYYISKYLDFLDTVFFVLRKKDRQISFLHVYHHTFMVFAVWAYMTLLYGSHFTMTGIINSFIHVLMYSYYFIAALKPSIDLNPWKRVLTSLQIMQFCFLSIHFLFPILNNSCNLDMFWVWGSFMQNLFLLFLFSDFYIQTYIRKPRAISKSNDSKVSLTNKNN